MPHRYKWFPSVASLKSCFYVERSKTRFSQSITCDSCVFSFLIICKSIITTTYSFSHLFFQSLRNVYDFYTKNETLTEKKPKKRDVTSQYNLKLICLWSNRIHKFANSQRSIKGINSNKREIEKKNLSITQTFLEARVNDFSPKCSNQTTKFGVGTETISNYQTITLILS